MDIDSQIEKVRTEAVRKIRRLKERKKKEVERLESEGKKAICDFVIGPDKNLQMQFVANIEKGEHAKLWKWIQNRASAVLAECQKDVPDVLVADLDLAEVDRVRQAMPVLQHIRPFEVAEV